MPNQQLWFIVGGLAANVLCEAQVLGEVENIGFVRHF